MASLLSKSNCYFIGPTKVEEGVCPQGALRVAPGLNSLLNALKEAAVKGITTVFLENGIHDEGGNAIDIKIPIFIVGESRKHCIVIGGLAMKGKKEDDIDVQNLTLRESKGNGLYGDEGASIHLDNVSVENSGIHGVAVYDSKRNSMKNCNVSHSKWSGLAVFGGGLMTIEGNATSIHHNCTGGYSSHYGLYTESSSSSIHIVSPLTKEKISTNNYRGRNYGKNYDGTITIQTIAPTTATNALAETMLRVPLI